MPSWRETLRGLASSCCVTLFQDPDLKQGFDNGGGWLARASRVECRGSFGGGRTFGSCPSDPRAAGYAAATRCDLCRVGGLLELPRIAVGSLAQVAARSCHAGGHRRTVVGDFNDATAEHHGSKARFIRGTDGRFVVETEGIDGKLATFRSSTPSESLLFSNTSSSSRTDGCRPRPLPGIRVRRKRAASAGFISIPMARCPTPIPCFGPDRPKTGITCVRSATRRT